MNEPLFGIPNADVPIVMGILIFFIVIETASGFLHRTKRNFGDWIQELGGFLVLSLGTKVAIVATVFTIGRTFFPEYQNAIAEMNFAIGLLLYLLVDDCLQYWYHRSAHEYEFLWKLHRSHHQAEEMGFFVSYRNAWLYYVLMPNLWWVGTVLFLGGIKAVALGLILKQIIVISAHSTVPYDRFLYKFKFLSPMMTVWERIFITPAFHYAHHGKTKRDGISDPNGNFGNMFSLWDQIFGTAKFTRQFPEELGLENDPKEHWTASYFYPIITAKDTENEMSRGHVKKSTATLEPITIRLEKGEKYLWCQCGKSKNQPFCDSSHHGSKIKPVLFEAKRTGDVRLCNCKATKAGPFCDDSHIELKKKV